MIEDENGFYGLESMLVDRNENIGKLLEFIFQTKTELNEIQIAENISIYDLSCLIRKNIGLNQLEKEYQEWKSGCA